MLKRKPSTEFINQKFLKVGLFTAIPPHIQINVLRKLDFKEFVKLKKCSKETVEICENFAYRIHLSVDSITVWNALGQDSFLLTVNVDGIDEKSKDLENLGVSLIDEPILLEVETFSLSANLTDDQFQFLEEFCQGTNMKAETLSGDSIFETNEPWMVDKIIKLLHPRVLSIENCSASFLLSLKELDRLRKIEFAWPIFESEREEFLLLKNPEIHLDGTVVSLPTINEFLKQWMVEEREMKELKIDTIEEDYSQILKDLEFAVIWSPETQESGPFSQLRLGNERRKVEKIYSLERNDGKKIFVAIVDYPISVNPRILQFAAGEYESIGEIENYILENYEL